MRVRPATPADVRGIAEVLAAVAEEGRWVLTEPGADVEALVARFTPGLSDPGTVEVILEDDDGAVVGSLGVTRAPARGVGELGMAILAAHRGRGWGGLLLDAGIEAARTLGHHKLALEVFPDNGAAIGLYVSRGFVVEGLLRDHHRRADGTLRSALVMGLPL